MIPQSMRKIRFMKLARDSAVSHGIGPDRGHNIDVNRTRRESLVIQTGESDADNHLRNGLNVQN
jgi:hypothetical protein